MADIKFLVVSTFFLGLIALIPVHAKECSRDTINECYTSTKYTEEKGHCGYYQDAAACLQELKANCTDDKLIVDLTYIIAFRHDQSTKCPGMKAPCMAEARKECFREIPLAIKNDPNYPRESKIKDCKAFKGKAEEAKQCFKDIQTQCNSEHVDNSARFDFKYVEDIESICAALN